jgi:AraC family transcriptional regulator
VEKQVQKAVYYIETHLDEVFDVAVLAKVAGYSPFHFSRIFKLYTGESVMGYTVRLRLERAAKQMQVQKRSLIEVALDAGYETPTGFLKAFKKRFGTTPTVYKVTKKEQIQSYKEIQMNAPKVVTLEERDVVFHRELGEYEKSSQTAWQKLSDKLNRLGKELQKTPPEVVLELTQENGVFLGIIHDDPKVTEEENIRYDAAIAWSKEAVAFLAKKGFETKSVAGGKYVIVLHEGTSLESYNTWYALYAWVEEQGYTLRDVPAFEKYLEVGVENSPLEIYIPIV